MCFRLLHFKYAVSSLVWKRCQKLVWLRPTVVFLSYIVQLAMIKSVFDIICELNYTHITNKLGNRSIAVVALLVTWLNLLVSVVFSHA